MDENISQNAGKVLLQIYLVWKKEMDVPDFNKLLELTHLEPNILKRALKYCYEKSFINLEIIFGMGIKKMDGNFWVKDSTAHGIDIIESPRDTKGGSLFNVAFNFNNTFNVESIIKGEVKLF